MAHIKPISRRKTPADRIHLEDVFCNIIAIIMILSLSFHANAGPNRGNSPESALRYPQGKSPKYGERRLEKGEDKQKASLSLSHSLSLSFIDSIAFDPKTYDSIPNLRLKLRLRRQLSSCCFLSLYAFLILRTSDYVLTTCPIR